MMGLEDLRHQQNAEKNFNKLRQELRMNSVSLEDLRHEVIKKEDLNLKLKTLLELSNKVDRDVSIFQPFVKFEAFSANLVELLNSLEHS